MADEKSGHFYFCSVLCSYTDPYICLAYIRENILHAPCLLSFAWHSCLCPHLPPGCPFICPSLSLGPSFQLRSHSNRGSCGWVGSMAKAGDVPVNRGASTWGPVTPVLGEPEAWAGTQRGCRESAAGGRHTQLLPSSKGSEKRGGLSGRRAGSRRQE